MALKLRKEKLFKIRKSATIATLAFTNDRESKTAHNLNHHRKKIIMN